MNGRVWKPPEELKGPNAHKVTTLAGNTYRKHIPSKSKMIDNVWITDNESASNIKSN